jgi:hypothetical protein
MNLRQGMLVTTFGTTLFMNFASSYWTMWSVATISSFVLLVTDFMFFEVRPLTAPPPAIALRPGGRPPRPAPPPAPAAVAWQDERIALASTLHPSAPLPHGRTA